MWSCSLPCVNTKKSGLQMDITKVASNAIPIPNGELFKSARQREPKLKLVDLLPPSSYDTNTGSPVLSPSTPSPSTSFSIDKTDNHETYSFGTDTVDLRREDERLKTFEKWPVTFLSRDELARNGFYYLGRGDEVRCAFCKVEIMRWVEGDDPAKDHQRWAPQCPFVRKLSGSAGSNLGTGHDECGSRTPSGSSTPPRMAGPVHTRFASETARLRSFQDWPRCMKQKPEDLAEAGFFYTGQGDKTKCFYCDGGLKDWENDDVPWEQHARWFDRCAYVQLVKGPEYVQKVMTEACAVSEAERPAAPARPPSPPSAPLDAPENSVDDSKLCKICYAEERNVCFVPCGHVVACAKCALAADKCPMCRRTFQNAVRLYFS